MKAGRLGRAPLVELGGAAAGVPVPATGLAGTSAVGGEGIIEGRAAAVARGTSRRDAPQLLQKFASLRLIA